MKGREHEDENRTGGRIQELFDMRTPQTIPGGDARRPAGILPLLMRVINGLIERTGEAGGAM
jgi:hypothetical protein